MINEEKCAIFRGVAKNFLAHFFYGMCVNGGVNADFCEILKQLTMVKSEFTTVGSEFTLVKWKFS